MLPSPTAAVTGGRNGTGGKYNNNNITAAAGHNWSPGIKLSVIVATKRAACTTDRSASE